MFIAESPAVPPGAGFENIDRKPHGVRPWWFGLAFLAAAWFPADHYPPWLGFHSELLAFSGFALILAACLRSSGATIAAPRFALGLGGLAAVPWLQWAAGINSYAGDALISSLYLVGFAASVLAGFRIASARGSSPLSLNGPMHLLWLSALASTAIAAIQWLGVVPHFGELGTWLVQVEPGERAVGNLGQPNQLASLLLMGMVAFAYAHWKRLIGKSGFVLGIAFMTVGLVLSQSRTGLLSGFVVAAFLAWKGRRHSLGASPRALALWALVFAVAFLALPYMSELLYLGKGRGTPLTDNNARWRLWHQVALGIWDSPWWGYGWNQTTSAHMAGAERLAGTLTISHAHNIFLDLMAWVGIPLGGVLIVALLYWTASRALRCQHPPAIFAMACLLPVLVHSLLEYPFAYAYFLLFAGLLCGVVEASTAGAAKVVPVRWLWAILGGTVVLGIWLAYEYLLIEEDFRMVRYAAANIGSTPATHHVPTVRLNSQLGALLHVATAKAKPRPGMSNKEIKQLQMAVQRFPYQTLRFRYALALGLNGRPAEAGRQMGLIKNLYGDVEYAGVKAQFALERERYAQLRDVPVP
jgi:O-antigen ligase